MNSKDEKIKELKQLLKGELDLRKLLNGKFGFADEIEPGKFECIVIGLGWIQDKKRIMTKEELLKFEEKTGFSFMIFEKYKI